MLPSLDPHPGWLASNSRRSPGDRILRPQDPRVLKDQGDRPFALRAHAAAAQNEQDNQEEEW